MKNKIMSNDRYNMYRVFESWMACPVYIVESVKNNEIFYTYETEKEALQKYYDFTQFDELFKNIANN